MRLKHFLQYGIQVLRSGSMDLPEFGKLIKSERESEMKRLPFAAFKESNPSQKEAKS